VIVSTLISFILVGLIEEVSKYWVLTRSARSIFSSIDDVMQLSIIVAIGFAFAENVINPVYFTGFVREFLLHGSAPDLTAFLSNVLGRSVLTSMVHIVSTGVLGYFLGLAIFGAPCLEEDQRKGKTHRLMVRVHQVLRLPELSIFRLRMLSTGLFCAIALHGIFNFLVTLPDILPGNPQSIGDIVGPDAPLILLRIPVLLLPALLYVVGGFWLLTSLFLRKENMVQRGELIQTESFVPVTA